jgi:hypothetical protein
MSYGKVDIRDDALFGIEATLQILAKCIARRYLGREDHCNDDDRNWKGNRRESRNLCQV